jgi:hypothetical protein
MEHGDGVNGERLKAQGNGETGETSETGETMKNIIVSNLDAIVFRLARPPDLPSRQA